MWRVHRNRVDAGLGATYSASGHHESMKQDFNLSIPNASWSLDQVIDGFTTKNRIDNPFLRWHKSFGDYPAFHSDMDDLVTTQTEDFERMKKFKTDPKKVVGSTAIIPAEDTDEKFLFYDI